MKGYEKRNELKKGVHGGELKYLLTKYDFWIFHFSTEFTLRLATRRSFTGFHAGDWLSRNQSENRKKREKSIVRGRRTRWHGRERREKTLWIVLNSMVTQLWTTCCRRCCLLKFFSSFPFFSFVCHRDGGIGCLNERWRKFFFFSSLWSRPRESFRP